MKKFTVINKDGSNWLRPINPSDENGQAWRGFQSSNPDLPYIGSHPEGAVLNEREVREVRQYRLRGSDHWFHPNDSEYKSHELDVRTTYTDVEPECPECGKYCSCPEEDLYDAVADYRINHPEPSHDRHARPFKTHNVRPLVNQLVGEEISFSRFIELLNEIANTH